MAKKRRKKKKTYAGMFFSVFFKVMLIFILVGIVFAGFIGFSFYNKYYKNYDKEAKALVYGGSAADFKKNEPTYIYDSEGDVIAKLRGDGDSTYLSYEDIPEYAVNAFIAIEDRTFWTNPGYDVQGIARVLLRYIKTKGVEQHGASTITQQLARNVYLTQEKKIERKIKEILIAKYLNKKYSKKEIMEYYINNVYFANQYYGLEAAAKGYFGKKASQLSLSQIAYLCAIPNRPAYYDPIKYPDHAIKRRNKILGDMKEVGLIDESAYDLAVNETISLAEQKSTELNDYQATFAMDCAVRYLMGLDGFEFKYGITDKEELKTYTAEYDEKYEETKSLLYSNGYKIYTTLNSSAQDSLQNALDEVLSFDEETNSETGAYALQGAVSAVDNINGKVIAVVGGRTNPSGSSSTYSLNRGYQGYRQPGSTIKPIVVYTPALELGYAPGSILENIDVSKAKTMTAMQTLFLSGKAMTLRSAVENSINGCAWQVYANISPKVGLAHIVDMEYQKVLPDDYNLATALGGFTKGVTTVEQAAGYSTLANHGVYRGQTCIASIKNNEDEELYVEPEEKEVYTAEAADTMIDIMKGVITKGTAKSMKWAAESDIEAAGKTGTTNGSKDGWFCGVTPYYSVAVWVGYDQPRELTGLYGATYPASIWKSAMLALTEGYDAKSFELPAKMKENSYTEKYLPGKESDEVLVSETGYTVANYRQDRENAEAIRAWNAQMSVATDAGTLNSIKLECDRLLNSIVDKSYAAILLSETNTAYAAGYTNVAALLNPGITQNDAAGVGGAVIAQ